MEMPTRFFQYSVLAIMTGITLQCMATGSFRLSTAKTETLENFKVAMLLPEAIDDNSFSQAGYEALKNLETKLNAEIAYTENIEEKKSEEIEKIIRKYADAGFDFIVAHGSEALTLKPTATVAAEFPRTKFAILAGDSPGNNSNLGILSLRTEELSYLTGVAAALQAQTNRICLTGGVASGCTQKTATWFKKGVKSIKPEAQFSIKSVGNEEAFASYIEIEKEESKSSAVPISVAASPGLYAIDPNKDLAAKPLGCLSIARKIDYGELLLYGATLVREGRWEGKKYGFGLREGIVELAPVANLLAESELDIWEDAKKDVLARKIEFWREQY
jgi:basic membrane protein A